MQPKSLASWDTLLPADMVERCPSDGKCEVAVATYDLVKDGEGGTEERRGAVHRLSLSDDTPELLQTVETPGVFDLKWHETDDVTFATAGADGAVHIFRDWAETLRLPLDSPCQDFCLCVGWDVNRERVAFGGRSGRLCIGSVEDETVEGWDGHAHEAWVVLWVGEEVLASGGDDGRLKVWDLRAGTAAPVSSRRFDAGVTSLTLLDSDGKNLLVGSYDEKLHLLSLPAPRRDIAVTDALGGGVWRVKRCPTAPTLLVAAMQGGAYKMEIPEGETFPDPFAHFSQHQSMVYGCEWIGTSRVATCSFYDHILHVWE